MIDSVEIMQIFRASQKRRNENAEGDRLRKQAMERFKRYFSIAGNKAEKTPEDTL